MGDHDPQPSTLSSASSSSYDPVLINPTSPSSRPSDPEAPPPSVRLRLTYPAPLPLIALADFAYTLRHYLGHTTAPYLLALGVIRVAILGGWVGLSRRWRTRGGYVAVGSLVSIMVVVWEECQGVLMRSSERRAEGGEARDVHTFFLVSTAILSAFEYFTYLLLLRLSPPSHRINPLSMRLPPSEIQESTIWDFETSQQPPISPLRQRHSVDVDGSPTHRRRPSTRSYASRRRASLPPPIGFGGRSYSDDEAGHDESVLWNAGESDAEVEDGMGWDEDGEGSDTSSISDSSIIDLPPPLAPERISIPPSISMTSGLSRVAAVMDSSPVLAPLVRRSRSARFLGKSWASRYSATEEMEARIATGRQGEGYGTFEREDE